MSCPARASLLALRSLLLSLLVALPASALVAAPATADAEPPGLASATQGSRLLHVTGGGTSFAVRVPGRSVSTFTWDPDDPGTVTHHLTSAGRTSLVSRVAAQDAPPAVTTAPGGSLPVEVDPTGAHQTIDGFGGALTHSAAALVDGSPHRAEILDALFGDDGARLSLVRLPVGASDLVAEPWESYADDPVRRLRSFTLARDRAHAVPLLRAAQRRNPGLRLMATPWSAPAWLKRGGTFTGSCTGKQNMLKVRAYRTYARYLTRYTARYDAMGLPLWTLGLQNEPGLCRTSYPTLTMSAGQQAPLATVLRRRLDAAGERDVAILAHDHNWYDDGATLADGPTTVPEQVLARTDAVDAIGYHCYGSGGDPTPWATQTTLAPVHMTECSGFLDHADAGANLVHEVRHDLIGPLRHGARSAFYWSLALGDDGGPHVGGCATCRGMVGIDRAGGAWSPNEDLAYWSQLSRFVDPGAVRIGSTQPGSSVETVAFRNPDGRLVLVVLDAAATGDYRGHLVRDAADTSAHPASWLVGVDGRRRWVPVGAGGCRTAPPGAA
ncbi:MAG: hypothetical protein CMH83_05815 [Nocardioides sp.]|nr:hypothetical protein [Nocardioides sp.]